MALSLCVTPARIAEMISILSGTVMILPGNRLSSTRRKTCSDAGKVIPEQNRIVSGSFDQGLIVIELIVNAFLLEELIL